MTGVQTCALPICFPVTIRRFDDYAEAIRLGIIDKPLDRNPEVPPGSVEGAGKEVNS